MKKINRTIAAALCGLGLVSGLAAAPVAAHALPTTDFSDVTTANNATTGTTEVTIKGYDPNNPDIDNNNIPDSAKKLAVKVPTKIPLIMTPDGAVYGPSDLKIKNEGAAKVKVSNVKFAKDAGSKFTITGDTQTDENSISVKFSYGSTNTFSLNEANVSGSNTAGTAPTNLEINPGSDTTLTVSGKVNKLSSDNKLPTTDATAVKLGTITFSFELA